jgi:hypothetical protein
MKMIVIHDKTGKIRSGGVPAPEFVGQVQLVPDKGERVTEIETKAVKDLAAWRNLRKSFRVAPEGKLLRKKKR